MASNTSLHNLIQIGSLGIYCNCTFIKLMSTPKRFRWIHFDLTVQRWMRENDFKPLDDRRTLHIMRNSVYRTATHVKHWPFINIFGDIDPKYVKDVKDDCTKARESWQKGATDPFIAKVNNETVISAVELTNRQMGLSGKVFKPAHIYQLRSSVPMVTSSGAPDYITPKSETFDDATAYLQSILDGTTRFPHVKQFWPVTIAWRTQMRESGVKHRIIAVFPQVVTLAEAIFATPIFKYYQENIGKTAYSFGETWQHNSVYWDIAQQFRNVVDIDWEKFDISISHFLLSLFYFNLRNHIDIPNEHYQHVFNFIRDYHLYGCVINQSNGDPHIIQNKTAGIMSGSMFTNFADSWINLFVINYICLESGLELPNIIRVMGDDVTFTTNNSGDIYLDIFRTKAKEIFNMNIGDKSKVVYPSEPIYYMGFYFTKFIKERPLIQILNSLRLGGRFISDEDLPVPLVQWSRFCSVLSVQSNGYDIFIKYKDKVLSELGISDPGYFHDLNEGPMKPFSLDRIITDVDNYIKYNWQYV